MMLLSIFTINYAQPGGHGGQGGPGGGGPPVEAVPVRWLIPMALPC